MGFSPNKLSVLVWQFQDQFEDYDENEIKKLDQQVSELQEKSKMLQTKFKAVDAGQANKIRMACIFKGFENFKNCHFSWN